MEITIIGWYGTETIGDRAILAGIFQILNKSFGEFHIRLGSLYPFYTERTVIEDLAFYQYCSANPQLKISIFDSQNPFELAKNIKESNLLAIGGGPLMDLREMNMLDYAFSFARRHKIKTVVLGCGWGPLKSKECIDIANRLVNEASLVIFRDNVSVNQYRKKSQLGKDVYGLIDPAFFACLTFLDKHKKDTRSDNYIACNFRDVALEGDHYAEKQISNEIFASITKRIQDKFDLPVKMVPMHNFFIGGDDRIILENIRQKLVDRRVEVIKKTQSLEQTMSLYHHSKVCVGMRFHSIVLQTMLNGRNIVIDYTDTKSGKIISMIKQLDIEQELAGRYFSLYSNNENLDLDNIKKIEIDRNQIESYEDKYIELLKNA